MSAGRPISFETDRVIEQATQVFWNQGYSATSMADLLAAMQLSRSSLYENFSSKEALFRRCLRHYSDTFANTLADELEQAADGREFIEQTFIGFARRANNDSVRRGCFAMNTAMELGHTDPELAGEARRAIRRFTRLFEKAIRQAQEAGTISGDKDATDLARYLVCGMGGLRLLIKTGTTPGEAERTAQLVLRGLD